VTKKSKMSNDESADIATKLELASAYIDMQDKEGALELLAEAIREGGPDQRKRAQALIDNLS
jgi:pilus assembly protein FimV